MPGSAVKLPLDSGFRLSDGNGDVAGQAIRFGDTTQKTARLSR